jgi:RNA recognition motif-containing protein
MNYGFVEFVDHLSAEQALLAMNGRKIFSSVRIATVLGI